MKKIILLVSFCLFIGSYSFGQGGTQNIRGTILDKQSKYALPGASIVVVGTDPLIGTLSDANGEFTLANVPLGRLTLRITLLGYAPRELPNILLSSGKESIQEIELEEQVIESQEVVVTDNNDKTATNNEMVSVSARQFTREEAGRYAGALNDPARMAANYAGVSNGNDGRNDIIIRGNSPLGLLWRIDGMPIPNPNHFGAQGTTGGPVSMLNYNQLANSDFLTGAFPSQYGNATSGVFDLRMRTGNNKKYEFISQIGFNGLELGAEGPFSKKYKGSFMINYRYSTLGVFQLLGVNFGTGTAIPQYQDLGFKIDLPTEKFGRFQVFGVGGLDAVNYLNKDIDTSAKSTNSYGFAGFNTYYKTNTGMSGVTHTYFINPTTSIKSGILVSYTGVNTIQDSVVYRSSASVPYFRANTTETRFIFNSSINKKFNSRNTLNAGFYLHNILFNYDQKIYRKQYGDLISLTNSNGTAQLLELYAQWQYKITTKLTLNPGLHYQQFLYNNSFAVEPRLGARYALLPNLSLNAGVGVHSQIQPLLVYFQQTKLDNGSYELTNSKLGFSKANHAVVGFDWSFANNWRIKFETYYQYLYNIPVQTQSSTYSMINSGANFYVDSRDSLKSNGTGHNYGIEFTLEKFYSKGYYMLFTTSLFESKYKGSDGVERNTAFDGNYIFNLLLGKEFKITNKITFDVNIKQTFAGGRRYTPIDVEASARTRSAVYDYNQTFADQFKPYNRTDLKVGVRIESKKLTHEFSVQVNNIFNVQNVFTQQYDPNKNELVTNYQIGRLIIPQYRILF